MSNSAVVRTQGDSLNVRSSPNGQIIDTLANGTIVQIEGSPIYAGSYEWVPIGINRWVAAKYLEVLSGSEDRVEDSISDLPPGAKVIATQTPETIAGGLKVYRTQLIDQTRRVIKTVRCVSGRVGLQTPSSQPNSQTPIPFGVYRFDYPGYVEYAPGEFGGVWSAVTPTFATQRSGFGIHYDPSTFSNNSQTGTAGCLATPTIEERDAMTHFIETYKPTHLVVQSGV